MTTEEYIKENPQKLFELIAVRHTNGMAVYDSMDCDAFAIAYIPEFKGLNANPFDTTFAYKNILNLQKLNGFQLFLPAK